MIGRREFVTAVGALAAGSVVGCRAAPAPAPDATPFVGRLGAQLYTVRDRMAADVAGTLERVAELGYDEVEFAGWFGLAPAQVRAALAAAGLAAPSAHVELAAIEGNWPATLDAAAAIGHEYLVLAWIDPARRRTADDWRRLADALGRAGEAARAAGLRMAYHNHDYEFVPAGGALPLHLLLDGTDPATVAFELDVYWMLKAGHDPLAWMARRPGRFALLHVKDTAGPPDHRMVDVGDGTADWARILPASRNAGARHWFVEHDEPGDGLRSLRGSLRYLRGLRAATRS